MIECKINCDGSCKVGYKSFRFIKHSHIINQVCKDIGELYKKYCESDNEMYRITTLARIQELDYLLRRHLIYCKDIKCRQDFQFVFEDPSPYKVLGGLDEESCM